MKNGSLLAVLGLALVLGLGFFLPAASGQTLDTVKVTLPFETSVGAAVLPAGDYTIREVDNPEGSVLEFTSTSGHYGALALANRVPTVNGQPAPKTEVVLRHDGSKYVPAAIWLQDRDYGYEFLGAAR